ncbi:helix-turn-helix transcriptional regulator [Methylobacterium sp. E-041]|jgi:AraC-like DNA-binding protein|uniref:AraC family transcriptional regulator n=3 Tax=Methylobacterium TaxID=407 RepID=UPI0011CA39DA|nr:MULTISPECIES: helix-turn-helix transcriptional regulator [unclassified Methylobacterium]MCJ2010011.1 helix-turn-helix transcriptional regulator [Methylobacterium sp. J-092]MCJ2041397.1 helix-turn-helix transcriptional regulator [Methylobacterium sp. J-059]MCJ2104271.1 helix-turn-helix transcriptional regulator [Methylobacterium sp. E-041]TXN45906.1 AraC family transcriptional regulator [Methylobacterium sp. WL119]TXN63628.1 AraC family transcriptional regulator [Methylobacterium sp. WL30]
MPPRSTDAADYQDVPRSVAVMPKAFAAASRTDRHFHPRAQLLYATAGLMMASADDGTWVVPEGHALLIPPRLPHAVAMHGAVAMCSAYLDPRAFAVPDRCRVIAVSPLLVAALAALAEEPVLYDEAGRGGHLAALVLDEIGRAPETPLALPLPRDARLRRVCLGLIEDPGSADDLDAWATRAGASRRTLTRGFRQETGLSFGDWRARARVIRALALAADGRPAGHVAAAVGYRSRHALRATVGRVLGPHGARPHIPG